MAAAFEEYFPAGHAVHVEEETAPIDEEALPAVQPLHELDPLPAVYVPAGQAAQLVAADTSAKLPGLHEVQSEVLPIAVEKVPVVQDVQADPLPNRVS